MQAPRSTDPPLEGLDGFAVYIERLVLEFSGRHIEIGKQAIWRACRRRRDPLPTWQNWNGRRFADRVAVRAWLLRHPGIAQLSALVESRESVTSVTGETR